ncbi:MAG: ABC transporter ATP-binding protein [Verrucomicrobiaceae bacterium]|jgi:ABC-type dipeptide/oligopeptide/nickel transport system ATPase component|nr:ABC transporter ATP-binding protein [Verrucomicrobiaceae bacterium]
MTDPLLHVRDLKIEFRRHDAEPMQAVQGIDLTLQNGESLALVGESGSGKSATALALARLLPEPPAKITAAALNLAGHDILRLKPDELRRVRGKEIAYIFQEPTTSLNPVLTIRTQIGEALALHRPDVPKGGRDAEIVRWLEKVGIVQPEKRLRAYPHELSGGMQQRVMIAMALCCRPKLLIADEPTTALDVTIQKQIMDLLAELRRELGMSIILITHNLGIIRSVADRVAVMFRGKIVETGPVDEILRNPQHAYTKALLHCVPRMGPKQPRLQAIDYELLKAG